MNRDPAFDGVFYTGVSTTGIFCRTTCTARKPRPENVRFFPGLRDAVAAGFRPCKRCRPLLPRGTPPDWVLDLIAAVEADPDHRWTDADLNNQGVAPANARRWFKRNHGLTFHDYARARRMARALDALRDGAGVTHVAFDAGYESLSGFNAAFKKVAGRPPDQARAAVPVFVQRIATPLGTMVAAAVDEGLVLLEFADRRMLETQFERVRSRMPGAVLLTGPHPHTEKITDELNAYFAGKGARFTTPLLTLGTSFQKAVWAQLVKIPAGRTRSYGQVAAEIGRPTAVRAVARANGDNRLAIVVPCHRVVGADGALTGYGGGLWRKRRLLELELQPSFWSGIRP